MGEAARRRKAGTALPADKPKGWYRPGQPGRLSGLTEQEAQAVRAGLLGRQVMRRAAEARARRIEAEREEQLLAQVRGGSAGPDQAAAS
jgi:hypothetical protein